MAIAAILSLTTLTLTTMAHILGKSVLTTRMVKTIGPEIIILAMETIVPVTIIAIIEVTSTTTMIMPVHPMMEQIAIMLPAIILLPPPAMMPTRVPMNPIPLSKFLLTPALVPTSLPRPRPMPNLLVTLAMTMSSVKFYSIPEEPAYFPEAPEI